jgi:hypothetical protein
VTVDRVLRGLALLCFRTASAHPEPGSPREGAALRAHRRSAFTCPVLVGVDLALPRERPALPSDNER